MSDSNGGVFGTAFEGFLIRQLPAPARKPVARSVTARTYSHRSEAEPSAGEPRCYRVCPGQNTEARARFSRDAHPYP